MTHLYTEYVELCELLGLSPSEEKTVTDVVNRIELGESGSGQSGLAELTDLGVSVVTFCDENQKITHTSLPSKYSSPCRDCVRVKLSICNEIYTDAASSEDTPIFGAALPTLFASLHDIPFATTASFDEQPWSIVMPHIGCSCTQSTSDTEQFTWDKARSREREEVSHSELQVYGGTSGTRAMEPSEFIALNRFAIGFASIVTNPIHSELRSVHLVNSFVYTGADLDSLETAGGKGFTAEQSLASWLGEAFERYYLSGKLPSNQHTVLVDPTTEEISRISEVFGMPALAFDGNVISTTKADWKCVGVDNLSSRSKDLLPTSLIWCPDLPNASDEPPTFSSTNGAATGATVQEATLQGLLELIERDAFWLYGRTGISTTAIPRELFPENIEALIQNETEGDYSVHLLRTPFDIHVVQTTFARQEVSAGESYTARGTGASHSLEVAIARSFAECQQMLDSLDTGEQIEPNSFDMRRLWFTGESVRELSNFFGNHSDTLATRQFEDFPAPTVDSIVMQGEHQGMIFYRYVLHETDRLAVVKVVGSDVNSMDPTFYRNSSRLRFFADQLELGNHEIKYRGSLFM